MQVFSWRNFKVVRILSKLSLFNVLIKKLVKIPNDDWLITNRITAYRLSARWVLTFFCYRYILSRTSLHEVVGCDHGVLVTVWQNNNSHFSINGSINQSIAQLTINFTAHPPVNHQSISWRMHKRKALVNFIKSTNQITNQITVRWLAAWWFCRTVLVFFLLLNGGFHERILLLIGGRKQ